MRPIAIAYSLPELVIPIRLLWLAAGALFAASSFWIGARRVEAGRVAVLLLASSSGLCLVQAARSTDKGLALETLALTGFGVTLGLGLVATGWATRRSTAALGQDPDRALACFVCSAGLGLIGAQSPIFAEYLGARQQPLQAEWLPALGIAVAAVIPTIYFHGEGLRARQWLDAVSPCALALGGIVYLATFIFAEPFFSTLPGRSPGEVAPVGTAATPNPLPLYLSGAAWLCGRLLLWHGTRRRFFGQTFLVAAMTYPGIEYGLRWLQRPEHQEDNFPAELATVGVGLGLASVLWRHWSASPLPPRTT